MTMGFLTWRSLGHYWRTNVAVVLGVATAVTVLAGALLVGDSVRGSLRDLVLERLGRTSFAILSTDFFREALAEDLKSDASFPTHFSDACPVVILQGLATNQTTGRRSLGVQIYGVDDRFWRFHHIPSRPPSALGSREVLLSAALARDIGAEAGGTVLLRIQKPSDIPLDSLHGRKDDAGSTIRLTFGGVMDAAGLGDFSLQPQQADVRAAFVPLQRLQQDLDLKGRVNAILVSAHESDRDPQKAEEPSAIEGLVKRHAALEDVGLVVRPIDGGALSVETRGTLIDASRESRVTSAANALGLSSQPVFTYLVNGISSGEHTVPYSLVTALDLDQVVPASRTGGPLDTQEATPGTPPIILNDWTARELHAAVGDKVSLDYLVWEDPGILKSRTTAFVVSAVVPIAGAAADRTLVPFYPGVTDSNSLRDWNPPFPIDLRRIRPQDEEYWRNHKTTPKAFIPIRVGQTLWQSRHGSLTSIRIFSGSSGQRPERESFSTALRSSIDPLALGLAVRNVRGDGIGASQGATDFGEYFTYFSFFLVVSALLLAVLFFKLGIEQRAREVGLLRAVGFRAADVQRLFGIEGLMLSTIGSLLGVVGAVGYASLMMLGLRTWWVESVGTTSLTLHVSAISLAAGVMGGVIGAVASIWWTLRSLGRISERSLLAGKVTDDLHAGTSRTLRLAISASGFAVLGLVLIAAGAVGSLDAAGAFFGAGASLLAACLCGLVVQLRRPSSQPRSTTGLWPLARLGVRNASYRPGRSVLSVAVVASAAFVLISVGAFRRDAGSTNADRKSGTGGYALIVNTLLPIVNAPDSSEGRDLIGLPNRPGVNVAAFRVRPGDDASCLNLYEPREPRIVGVGSAFVGDARFSFQSSLGTTDEDRKNPWRLLEQRSNDGTVPAIADANSMTYVLHKALGDEIVVTAGGGARIRLRLVAALQDSFLQGEVLISDQNFVTHFPDQPGYQLLLVDAPAESMDEIAATLEDRLGDFGADAVPAAARLAEFHRVENTYLSTFQTLGGLGLLLGTLGLAAVLLRNVLERKRELALLSAIGYRRANILTIVMAENAFLLVTGLTIGAVCALVAIAPAAIERGGRIPAGTEAAILLASVLALGLLSSLVATRATLRTRLLTALKAE